MSEGARYLRIDAGPDADRLLSAIAGLGVGVEVAVERPTTARVAALLSSGADRVIGLQSALEDPGGLTELAQSWGTRFVPGLAVDDRGRWAGVADGAREALGDALRAIGLPAFSLWGRSEDGRETALPEPLVREVAQWIGVPLVLAGDLRDQDVRSLSGGDFPLESIAVDPHVARALVTRERA